MGDLYSCEPADSAELASIVENCLWLATDQEPEEYEPQKFSVELEGREFVVLAVERDFPYIRLEHKVMQVDTHHRLEILEFVNALHGQAASFGVHWWLGNEFLWQHAGMWAWTFDRRSFNDLFAVFVQVATDRTPEICARYGGSWPVAE